MNLDSIVPIIDCILKEDGSCQDQINSYTLLEKLESIRLRLRQITDECNNLRAEKAAVSDEIEMLKKIVGLDHTEHVTHVNDDLSYLTTNNGRVRRLQNVNIVTFNDMESKLQNANEKAELWDSVEPVLRNWLFLRDSLSGDCESLGIGPTSADSGKWGAELDNRCRRLRLWCSEHFYKDYTEAPVYKYIKRAVDRRVVNDAVSLLCRIAAERLPPRYKLLLIVSMDGASIEVVCETDNTLQYHHCIDECGWFDAIEAAIEDAEDAEDHI